MTKQRTDNLGLILLDDHDEDSFYADLVENLNKVNAADKAQTQARTDGDAATLAAAQAYIDVLIQGKAIKSPLRVVATTNLTLSGTQTVDGVALAAGDSVGAFGQTNGAQVGFYVVQPGAWTRRSDLDTSAEVTPGLFVWATEGDNGDTLWELKTDGPITLGTTPLVFEAKAGKGAGLALNSDLQALAAATALFAPGSSTWLKANVNNVVYTAITRDGNGAATSATVAWPDGTAGVYTADTVSTAFPGAVDAYHVTYAGTTTKTVTQPAVMRDPYTGAVTAQPALVVS